MEDNGYPTAKIPMDQSKIGKSYVLCLYSKDDSDHNKLKEKYNNHLQVRYVRWKSDEETKRGAYSQRFLKERSETLAKNKLIK